MNVSSKVKQFCLSTVPSGCKKCHTLTNAECCTLNYVCSRRSFCWQRLQATQKGHTKGTCTVGLQTAAVINIWHCPKVKVCSAGDYWNSEGCVDCSWFVQHWWWVQHVEGYNWNYWLGKKCIYVHMYLYNYLIPAAAQLLLGSWQFLG